jgi:hypothetical protein
MCHVVHATALKNNEHVLVVQKACVGIAFLVHHLHSFEYLRNAQVVGLGWDSTVTVTFFKDLVKCSEANHNFQCCCNRL